MKILKMFVLSLSITGVSCIVWNAARDKKPEESEKEKLYDPKYMQSSSKSAAILRSDSIEALDSEHVIHHGKSIEGIPADASGANVLMSSSKRGSILSPKDVEDYVVNRKDEDKFLSSTKNPNRLVTREELEQLIEGRKSDFEEPLEPTLPALEEQK